VLVAEVDRLYGMFVDAVAGRRSVNAAVVRGTEAGILYGEDAVAVALPIESAHSATPSPR